MVSRRILPAAVAYVLGVVSAPDPYKYSIDDPNFRALPRRDRAWVVGTFDGYGLQSLVNAWIRTGRLRVRYGFRDDDEGSGETFNLTSDDVPTWTPNTAVLTEWPTADGQLGDVVCMVRQVD